MIRISSSFRDPSGRVYENNGVIYRTITEVYKSHYETLMSSGLYDELTSQGLLIPHTELPDTADTYWKLISPQKIDFISYPFEWSFLQWKDAALLTLEIMKRALKHGMCLKDASAFNVQFYQGKPVFIDTLSFETREKGSPWIAYGQFCRHFLAPLLLMSYRDIRLQHLFLHYLDGISLDLASKLLPVFTWIKPSILLHIHLHARMIVKSADNHTANTASQNKLKSIGDSTSALIDSLTSLVQATKSPVLKTEWGSYYANTNYSAVAFDSKKEIVDQFLSIIRPQKACDLGANDGTFSRIASKYAKTVISADVDPVAVENNYRQLSVTRSNQNIVPALLDLNNPNPSLGWADQEWMSFSVRCKSDVVLALGLLHHLCISNNIPLIFVAEYFSRLGEYVIVEFVPKTDSNAQKLLSTRKDIFPSYTKDNFEIEFGKIFKILDSKQVVDSQRIIYLLRKR